MNALVSIIVPCFNQANFLKESLQSVLDQTHENWECIIVNDGSPDNTEDIANKWCETDNRFRYFKKPNGGLSSARNAGIRIAKGDFILPLDADDILDKSYISRLLPELISDNSLSVVSCYSKFFEKNISNIVYEFKPVGSSYRNLLFENNLIATSLFRKKDWTEVGGYDEKMKNGFEDWEFWISITKSGRKYKIVEEFLFYYRKSRNSMLIDTLENHRISNLEYVIEKHREFYKDNFDNTVKYLFFLLNLFHKNDLKIKNSTEFKLAKIIGKPLKLFKKRIKR